jgi:hypothetical protein
LRQLNLTIPATSVEYVEVTISAKADPTALGVQASLRLLGVAPLFQPAEWDTSQTNALAKTYVARFLFGSANFPAVADEHYDVHLRIDGATEDPVLYVGQIHTPP